MRVKFKPWAKDFIKDNPQLFINSKTQLQELVNQYDHVVLEIGCGKGQFAYQCAQKHPHSLYIAIEQVESIIVNASSKKDKLTPNLYFMAINIAQIIDNDCLDHKVKAIYLNFSDPWPKKRHHKRRLSAPSFLKIYQQLLINEGHIYMKTDNDDLFADSIVSFSQNGFIINDMSLDLHQSKRPNIVSEYEAKFVKQGIKIKYCDVLWSYHE